MAATLKVGKELKAVCDGYHWTSEDKDFERVLNGLLDPLGPSGADPNPDLHAAEAAAKALRGEVVSFDETEYEEGRVY